MGVRSDKILFLDIDGVLNSDDNLKVIGILNKYVDPSISYSDSYGIFFDQRCINWLRYILHKTGADLIITGVWAHKGLEGLQEMWEHRQLPGKIVDIVLPNTSPWDWLDRNDHKGTFCIVNSEYTESIVVVKTFKEIGLQLPNVHKIITILNN